MLYTHIQIHCGNIVTHNLRTPMSEWTHFFIKIYASNFILEKGWCFCGVWEMGGETYPKREDFFFPYLLQGARGCQRLQPLQARQRRLWSAACPSLDCYSLHSPESDHVVLITWSPSGYTPVVPECPDRAVLFTNQHVTAFQSTRGH